MLFAASEECLCTATLDNREAGQLRFSIPDQARPPPISNPCPSASSLKNRSYRAYTDKPYHPCVVGIDLTTDEQGYAARNLSLSGVSKITGLHRLEVREIFIGTPASEGGAGDDSHKAQKQVGPIPITVLTNEGELLSAGETFSVDIETGTFRAPRIGPHEVVGDVDFLGNGVQNAVLESPEIRQEETKDT